MSKPDHPDTLDFLLAQNCYLHHTRANQLFESIGLYRGQPRVLFALWDQEGVTQRELADQLSLTPATITKMLQRMEKSGFITRKQDPGDQRISRVYLTEAGRQVKAQVENVWETMEAETFENLTSEERSLLHRFFIQIRDNLAHATGEDA
jgi:DNA-binding MarR family transcriptional regulator